MFLHEFHQSSALAAQMHLRPSAHTAQAYVQTCFELQMVQMEVMPLEIHVL